jgi:hypothetical protein
MQGHLLHRTFAAWDILVVYVAYTSFFFFLFVFLFYLPIVTILDYGKHFHSQCCPSFDQRVSKIKTAEFVGEVKSQVCTR